MKKFYAIQILAILLTLISSGSYSQAPLSVPYQAVARNSSGNLIQSQTVALRFTIHSGTAAGIIVYQETQSVSTGALGLFSVNIGQGIPVSTYGSFSGINWASAPKFMQVEIDVTGGTSYLDMGTQQMMSVPYALYAETSGHALGSVTYAGTWDAAINSPLLQSSAGTQGTYYVVSTSGNHDLNGITDWQVGDWAIYNGTAWEKVDNTDSQTDASSVSYSPTSGISSTNVQDAIEEVDSQFADLIDSYIHKTDDGLAIYLPPGGPRKRLGIGDTLPAAPLGVKGETGGDDRMISFKSSDALRNWNINLNPTISDVPGFSIDDASSGTSTSRLFIDQSGQGNVGIGTVAPNARLAVSGSTVNGYTAMSIVNSSSGHSGWLMGHLNDNVASVQNGAFSILENTGTTLTERITVLPFSNVGVNEKLPYATLHVTRPATDAQEPVALSENTGILVLGPIDNKNLAFDSHQIQARTGSYTGGGSTLSFVASELNLQPLGGDLIIHNNLASGDRVSISGDGKVGIGVVSPTAALHVEENAAVTTDVATAKIESKSSNSTGSDFTRIGLEISNSQIWSSNALSKDIGIYVKQVSGQAGRESNIAAVINGNTVIGNLVSGNNIVGTGGRNVLAIQNGDEPTSQAGSSLSSGGGIQIYSHTDAVGTSVFSVMNGDGTKIKLYGASALSVVDNSVISTSSYGTTEAAVIENLRLRINELESKLQAMGLLQ